MHFFYIDESGDTGLDLNNLDQPILVLGGVDVVDSSWMTTQSALSDLLEEYFEGDLPDAFELHAKELLSLNGGGPFAGQDLDRRAELAKSVLGLIEQRSHSVHFIAVDKAELSNSACASPTVFDSGNPWLLAYDYLITYLNWYVREKLGHTARGMIIHDEKTNLQSEIERIAHERRFEDTKTHRVKWIVEFSYPVDSRKNPMIQMSDLVTFCIRRFLEIDRGHRDSWNAEAKRFYAECYELIDSRVRRKSLVERGGASFASLNEHMARVQATPRRLWRSHWLS